MNVVVNGLMVNYRKAGKGKAVVLLHGWGDSSQTFAKLAEQLADSYTLLIPDLPGFGGSQMPEEVWGLRDYADFVSDWLKKIGVREVYALAGHSFGGSVAITGTGEKILKPKRLVLLASSGVRMKKPLRLKLMAAAAKSAKLTLLLFPAAKRQKLKAALYKKAGSDAMLIPHMRLIFSKIVKEDVRETAGRITQPTLLLWGESDRETPPSDGRLLNRLIPASELEVLNRTGHFLHQEQVLSVANLIKDFLIK